MNFRNTAVSVLLALASAACTMNPPPYATSFQNVQKIKKLQQPVNVGKFDLGSNELASISLRANTMKPAQGSFADYVRGAAVAELQQGNKLATDSQNELIATLTENVLDSSGFETGHGRMAARFTLKRGSTTSFNKTLSANVDWPSSFVGSIAIPNAVNAYPDLVEKLLGNLWSDPDFVNALK